MGRSVTGSLIKIKGLMTNFKKKNFNGRIEKNLKALEVLTKQSSSLDKEESKTILNGYSGWGGLRTAIKLRKFLA